MIEWISVKDRIPSLNEGLILLGGADWIECYECTEDDGLPDMRDVTHWAHIEFPKEDEQAKSIEEAAKEATMK